MRAGFARRHEATAGVAHDLGDAADVGGHHRTAASQRLQNDVGATFHITWQRDQIGCRHPDGNIVKGATGQRVDVAGCVVGIDGFSESTALSARRRP